MPIQDEQAQATVKGPKLRHDASMVRNPKSHRFGRPVPSRVSGEGHLGPTLVLRPCKCKRGVMYPTIVGVIRSWELLRRRAGRGLENACGRYVTMKNAGGSGQACARNIKSRKRIARDVNLG